MGKLVFFAGFVAAAFMLFQFNAGKITMNDAFELLGIEAEVKPDTRLATEKVIRKPSTNIYKRIFSRVAVSEPLIAVPAGAIIPDLFVKSERIAEFFSSLSQTRNVKTFVVIGEDNILDGSIPSFIEETFPDAEIVPIFLKESGKKGELEEIAESFTEYGKEDVFVLAAVSFSKNMDAQTTQFHNELNQTVLETFDKDGVEQMDVGNRPDLFTLLSYLDLIGAKQAEIQDDNVVVFYEGDPVSNDRDLTIMAFGDMMLGRYVRTLMNRHGMDYVFENIKGPEGRFFEGADIIHGNLEGPIRGEGLSGGTSMVFAFNEDIAQFLKENGFNLVSIANNHATDQGWVGRDTTIEALNKSGVGWCGHPSEADPTSVYYGKVGDKDFAFLCFQDVTYKLDDQEALELIRSVRSRVDYLIVSIHWGYEYKHSPNGGAQVEPGRAFIDAGADFVIGHHPHVVQSFEEYKGRLIFYSLGNFVFDQYWSTEAQEELAIGIVLDDADEEEEEKFRTKIYLFPMKSEMSQSRLMTGDERGRWIEKFIDYGEYSEEMKEQIRMGVLEIGS